MIYLFPKIGKDNSWIEVDAVISSTINASISYTNYPIEMGANVSDHGIIQPKVFTLQGGVSANPLGVKLTDFAGGFFSNFFNGSRITQAAGLSAGYLAGSDEGRPASTLTLLYQLMYARKAFDFFTGFDVVKNVVITNISVDRNTRNENAIVFDATLQELITIDRIDYKGRVSSSTNIDSTNSGDPVQTMNGIPKSQGTKTLGLISLAASKAVTRLLT